MTTQNCPICASEVEPNKRYPRYVCEICAQCVCASDGRSLNFQGNSGLGGIEAFYADDGTAHPGSVCYVHGVECRYSETRFGGIVLQPTEAGLSWLSTKAIGRGRKTEKALDHALAKALEEDHTFVAWLLEKTKFRGRNARCVWVRSDHPWGKAELNLPDSPEPTSMEGETDVLAVFESESGGRFALHFENKLATGRFRHLQPELYRARAEKWKSKDKYGNYSDWEIVLVAPDSFLEKFAADALKFPVVISHEDLAQHLPAFAST